MLQNVEFDRIDLKMLAFLQEHGRASNLELSQFLMDTLMGLPGVSNVRPSVCRDEINSTGSLPLPQ